MSDEQMSENPKDGPRLVGVFAFWAVLLTIVAGLAIAILPEPLSVLLMRAVGFLPMLLAGFLAGQSYGRRHQQRLPVNQAWRLALVCVLLVSAVYLIAGALFFPTEGMLSYLNPVILSLILFVFLMSVLALRVMFTIGARMAIVASSPD